MVHIFPMWNTNNLIQDLNTDSHYSKLTSTRPQLIAKSTTETSISLVAEMNNFKFIV